VLDKLFSDITGGVRGAGLFPDNMFHLGGDEVCGASPPLLCIHAFGIGPAHSWSKVTTRRNHDAATGYLGPTQPCLHAGSTLAHPNSDLCLPLDSHVGASFVEPYCLTNLDTSLPQT